MNYYYSQDGIEVLGPCSIQDLVSSFSMDGLPATTQVCKQGSNAWQPLSSLIDELSLQSDSVIVRKAPPLQRARQYICPQCQSDNIQSAKLLYEGGTSTSVSTGTVFGVVGMDGSGIGLGGGTTTRTTKRQTLLARRYAPPNCPDKSNAAAWFLLLCGLIVGPGVPILMHDADINELGPDGVQLCRIFGGFLGIAMVVSAIIWSIQKSKKYAKGFPAYKKRLAEWNKSYLCHKCGFFGTLS